MRRVWFLPPRREKDILLVEEEEAMFILREYLPRRSPLSMERRKELMLLLDLRRVCLGSVLMVGIN